ncbi:hypothetical protein QR680_005141 [Steinernema hermaphroditum]|uniref:Uncharacterized protein n=1 Tax=Steinernema hermaphroditum TaxID=289476 RepID=A0AA39HT69_9BILA|nr:hypothetical protein QR680_005141 [Steinernema hermaphroditum]
MTLNFFVFPVRSPVVSDVPSTEMSKKSGAASLKMTREDDGAPRENGKGDSRDANYRRDDVHRGRDGREHDHSRPREPWDGGDSRSSGGYRGRDRHYYGRNPDHGRTGVSYRPYRQNFAAQNYYNGFRRETPRANASSEDESPSNRLNFTQSHHTYFQHPARKTRPPLLPRPNPTPTSTATVSPPPAKKPLLAIDSKALSDVGTNTREAEVELPRKKAVRKVTLLEKLKLVSGNKKNKQQSEPEKSKAEAPAKKYQMPTAAQLQEERYKSFRPVDPPIVSVPLQPGKLNQELKPGKDLEAFLRRALSPTRGETASQSSTVVEHQSPISANEFIRMIKKENEVAPPPPTTTEVEKEHLKHLWKLCQEELDATKEIADCEKRIDVLHAQLKEAEEARSAAVQRADLLKSAKESLLSASKRLC